MNELRDVVRSDTNEGIDSRGGVPADAAPGDAIARAFQARFVWWVVGMIGPCSVRGSSCSTNKRSQKPQSLAPSCHRRVAHPSREHYRFVPATDESRGELVSIRGRGLGRNRDRSRLG